MIKFEKTDVWGFEHALRSMRNPKESWSKSDSKRCDRFCEKCKHYDFVSAFCSTDGYKELGENDLKLMKNLIKAGSDHSKFTRQIMVSVDITAPDYWFKETDTYKVGTVANSTSTMHKIMSKPFTDDMFSWEKCYIPDWKEMTLAELNYLRARWLETKDKKDWYCLIQMLPMAYNYTRTCTLNYAVIWNMYKSRCLVPHKLDEWAVYFKEWAESLPFFKEMFLEDR